MIGAPDSPFWTSGGPQHHEWSSKAKLLKDIGLRRSRLGGHTPHLPLILLTVLSRFGAISSKPPARPGSWKRSFRAIIAQAILASLLASAMAATVVGRQANNRVS
jgi:hypothetical protein